jgi:hypothetical protein
MEVRLFFRLLGVTIILLFSACSLQVKKEADQVSKEYLQNHVQYLASDKLQGRGPGSEGQKLAEKYVDSIFHELSLKALYNDEGGADSYLQKLAIERYSVENNTKLRLVGSDPEKAFILHENHMLFHFGKLENEELSGELVYLGDGIYEPDLGIDDYSNTSVENKWIVMTEEISEERLVMLPEALQLKYEDPHTSSIIRSETASGKGAAGILMTPSAFGVNYWKIRGRFLREYYATGNLKSPYRNSDIPVIFIDSVILKVLKSGNFSGTLEYEKHIKKYKAFYANNVVGMVPGTRKNNKSIVVGAHLDHLGMKEGEIFNGADDNASGVAGILEMARTVSAYPCKCNVIFIAFAGEEIGDMGSNYFINNLSFDKNEIGAMIALDMIGRLDADTEELAVISPNIDSSMLIALIEDCRYEEDRIDWEYMESWPRKHSGDHFPFVLADIPALWLFSGIHPDYHQLTDDSEKIDFSFLHNNTRFALSLLRKLDEKLSDGTGMEGD